MRKCGNCYNGHYNLSNRGEEMYCDESEFMDEDTEEEKCCEYHRYYPGLEEEKNYLFYDEAYLAPGYLIVNMKNGQMNKFLKICNVSENGFPLFDIRAYSSELKEDSNERFSKIDFTFRDLEDEDNGLYKCFKKLYYGLLGKSVNSVAPVSEGNSNFKLDFNSRVTTMTISKDIYKGLQHPTDYIDILVGDEVTCDNYQAMLKFYQELSAICVNKLSCEEVKELLLIKK